MGEEFGARDPYAAELESNFTDKVLGNADTEHRIFIGKLSHIFKNRMADMEISSEYNQAVDDAELEDLVKKVGQRGWRRRRRRRSCCCCCRAAVLVLPLWSFD